jgi:hypothetical protein
LTPSDLCGGPCESRDTIAATPTGLTLQRFRLIPVRSPLLGESMFLSIPAGTEMFQFPAFPPLLAVPRQTLGRFPDLGDLRIIACLAASRSLSQLNHVLHRLWTPRHPPCTLSSLTTCARLRDCIRCDCFPDPPCFQRTFASVRRRDFVQPSWARRECHAVIRAGAGAAPGGGLGSPRMVEAKGLEPSTPWLQTMCSTN